MDHDSPKTPDEKSKELEPKPEELSSDAATPIEEANDSSETVERPAADFSADRTKVNLDDDEDDDDDDDEGEKPREISLSELKNSDKIDRPKTKEYPPATTFEELELEPELKEAIANAGWSSPTPVQGLCLPYTLKDLDVAGFAQTGTGKTGVFLITVANAILRSKKTDKHSQPYAVVLAPTRELAIQIHDEAEDMLKKLGISSVAVYGGSDWETQSKEVKAGVDIILATPGRLKDYHEKKVVNLSQVSMFVCDEVDRMFDMGFIDDVEYFLSHIPEDSQKLLFSATTNENVKELAFEYLDNPAYLSVSPDEITPDRIKQHAVVCETQHKFLVLLGLLSSHAPERAIIFTNTKLTADWIHYKLVGNGFDANIITGDLSQSKRIRLIKRIKSGDVKVLIATDVASRGLHIAGVTHVYNFDIPDDASNYVHRIGRTARAGAIGESYSLVDEEYGANYEAIQGLIGELAPACEWYDPAYLEIEDKSGNPFIDNFGKGHEDAPPRRGSYDNNRSPNRSDTRKPQRPRDREKTQTYKARDNKQKRHGKPAKTESLSLFGWIRKIFAVLFGWGKPKAHANANSGKRPKYDRKNASGSKRGNNSNNRNRSKHDRNKKPNHKERSEGGRGGHQQRGNRNKRGESGRKGSPNRQGQKRNSPRGQGGGNRSRGPKR